MGRVEWLGAERGREAGLLRIRVERGVQGLRVRYEGMMIETRFSVKAGP